MTTPSGRGGQRRSRGILRYDPATDEFEVYNPPAPGYGPRGVDVDTKGIIWTGLGGSGHLAKFDRSKCKQTWGTGDQCPEGWTLYLSPGPKIQTGEGPENVTNADFHYYLWVDQFNTLGMGKDTVVLNGTGSDSLLALTPAREVHHHPRPIPQDLFTRGLDGRIDDPKTGWKGRGLWFDNGTDPVLHSEVQQSYVGKVQLRPNPLARSGTDVAPPPAPGSGGGWCSGGATRPAASDSLIDRWPTSSSRAPPAIAASTPWRARHAAPHGLGSRGATAEAAADLADHPPRVLAAGHPGDRRGGRRR